MPELSDRILCDGLEMKFTSPFGWIQQTDAPDTACEKSYRYSLFWFRLVITRAYIQVCILL